MSSNIYTQILLGSNKNTNTVIKCEKCGSDEVRVREQQTRSSDEPVSIFITCKKCRFVSVDMGD